MKISKTDFKPLFYILVDRGLKIRRGGVFEGC